MKKIIVFSFLWMFLIAFAKPQPKTKIVIDADTGNELDDFLAITSAVLDTNIQVDAVISSHFNNVQLLTDSMWHVYPTRGINTVAISQHENERLLDSLGRNDIPVILGCDRMVGFSWGYYPGAFIPTSPGVDFIIKMAQHASPDDKLNIVVLGPITNVAAAVLHEPEIAKRIRVYALIMDYDADKKAWNKNSFNARNDINALDVVLNNVDIELHLIPANVSSELYFMYDKWNGLFNEIDHPVSRLLHNRWEDVKWGNKWIMYDLALIEAIIYPEMAKKENLPGPPENTKRLIPSYTSIKPALMEEKFLEKLKDLQK